MHEETKLKIQNIIAYFESEQTPGWTISNKLPHNKLAQIVLPMTIQWIEEYNNQKTDNANPKLNLNRLIVFYRQHSNESYTPGCPIVPLVFINMALVKISVSIMLLGNLMVTFSALAVAFPPLILGCLNATALCFFAAMIAAAWIANKPSGLSLMIVEVADAMDAELKRTKLMEDIQAFNCEADIKEKIDALLKYTNQMPLAESCDVLTDIKTILSAKDVENCPKLWIKYATVTGTSTFFTPVPQTSELNALMFGLIGEPSASSALPNSFS